MKPIDLKDLTPMGATITLKSTGKEYRLRPFTLADEKWLQETFGNDLEKIFREINMVQIARIAFHQMEDDDRRDFVQRDVTFINEDGEEKVVKRGGAELFFWMISGMEEKLQIFQALMHTIGISRAVIDQAMAPDTPPEEKKSQPSP